MPILFRRVSAVGSCLVASVVVLAVARVAAAGGANFAERLFFLGSCDDGTACEWACNDNQTCAAVGGSVPLVGQASCSAQYGENSGPGGCALRAHSTYANDLIARLVVSKIPTGQACAIPSDPGPCYRVAFSALTPDGAFGLADAEFDVGNFANLSAPGGLTNVDYLGSCSNVGQPCSIPVLRDTAPFCGTDEGSLLNFDEALRQNANGSGLRGSMLIEPFRSELLAKLSAQRGQFVTGTPAILTAVRDTASDAVCLRLRVLNKIPSELPAVTYPSAAIRGTDETPELGDCATILGLCGNGTLESSEECDDGNINDGDCCSAACAIEPDALCDPARQCRSELDAVTAERDALLKQTADDDGDGVPNPLDRCPGTAATAEVDFGGCAQSQFCAGFDADEIGGRTACRRSDWKNDEPRGHARDCKARRMPGVPTILCVVAP